jgi:hypothetical protein
VTTVSNVVGTRTTKSVYTFERLLNTGTSNQGVISLGASNNFIWAGGSSDAIV